MKAIFRLVTGVLLTACLSTASTAFAYDIQIQNNTHNALNIILGHKEQKDNEGVRTVFPNQPNTFVPPNSTTAPVSYDSTFNPDDTNVPLGTKTDFWQMYIQDPNLPVSSGVWLQADSCPLENQTVRDDNNNVERSVTFVVNGDVHDPKNLHVTMNLNPSLICEFEPMRLPH